MVATWTPFLLLLKQNQVAHHGDRTEGGAVGSSGNRCKSRGRAFPGRRGSRWWPCELPHEINGTRGADQVSANQKLETKRATRRWRQGARRGGVQQRGVAGTLTPLLSFHLRLGGETLSVSFCFQSSCSAEVLRWYLGDEQRERVHCSSLHLGRGAGGKCLQVGPGKADAPQNPEWGSQAAIFLPRQHLRPLPHRSFIRNGLIVPVISLNLTRNWDTHLE